jgi:hypothetical protein
MTKGNTNTIDDYVPASIGGNGIDYRGSSIKSDPGRYGGLYETKSFHRLVC